MIAVQGPIGPLVDLHEMLQARAEEWLEAQATWAEIRSLGIKARRTEYVSLARSTRWAFWKSCSQKGEKRLFLQKARRSSILPCW